MKLGKTTYVVGVHFSQTAKDTLEDKMKRLMKDDVKSSNFDAKFGEIFPLFILTKHSPKGSIVVECGKMLRRKGYRIKIMNTINFKKSHHYNPFSYIHSEKDILKLVNCLIVNTKGEGGKSGDDFWLKAEMLLYTALIGYIHYEAPEEEQNFSTLGGRKARGGGGGGGGFGRTPWFWVLGGWKERDPGHFAVRQYAKYKLAAVLYALKDFLIKRLGSLLEHTT